MDPDYLKQELTRRLAGDACLDVIKQYVPKGKLLEDNGFEFLEETVYSCAVSYVLVSNSLRRYRWSALSVPVLGSDQRRHRTNGPFLLRTRPNVVPRY